MNVYRFIKDKILYRLKIDKYRKNGVIIKNKSQISNFENIRFGSNIYIGPDSMIMAKGGLTIGNNVRIGPRSLSDEPIQYYPWIAGYTNLLSNLVA